jgi:hypothetical protein
VNAEIRSIQQEGEVWRDATAGLGEPSPEAQERGDELERRLAILPIQGVAVVGVRAALRALPLMSTGRVASAPFLMMLRVASLTWAAAAYPARTPNLVTLNPARVDAINNGGALVRAVAGATAGYSPNEFDKILEEVSLGIRALRAASSQLDGDAGGAVFDLALSQDLNDLSGAPQGAAALAQLELWPGGAPPEWMARRWNTLKRDLIEAGVGWEVWAAWYEDRLAGRVRSEAQELAYVEVPDVVWGQGIAGDPAVVNTWIMRQFNRLADQASDDPPDAGSLAESIPAIPKPGPGPRFQVSDEGPIERAPTTDVDEHANDVRTINQLKPLILRCASELQVRLSRNEFPELLATIEHYGNVLNPGPGSAVEWGEVWGLGVMLQNAASSAERQIAQRLLPPLEDPAKTALDSLLTMHGPLILATSQGAELSAKAQAFAMTREQQADLRAASEQVAQQFTAHPEVITASAAASIAEAASAVGKGNHPERGTVYLLANMRNVAVVLIAGAAVTTPPILASLMGAAAATGAGFSFIAVEALKKNPTFNALVTHLGASLEKMLDLDPRAWLEDGTRRFAPFRSFVIANEEPLRKIAASTKELRWLLRYIDFIVGRQ